MKYLRRQAEAEAAVAEREPILFGKADVGIPGRQVGGRIPTFTVDLAAPAEERWRQVTEHFKPAVQQVVPSLREEMMEGLGAALGDKLGSLVLSSTTVALGVFGYLGLVAAADELCAVAAQLELPVGELIVVNLSYESSALCTSAIFDLSKRPSAPRGAGAGAGAPHKRRRQAAGRGPLHVRSLDWNAPWLPKLLCNVNVVKGKAPIFFMTTFAGYLGCLTGVKPGCFSVAVNFRSPATMEASRNGSADAAGPLTHQMAHGAADEGAGAPSASLWKGASRSLFAALLGGGWSIGALVRACLTTQRSFDGAVAFLSGAPLIAPTYLSVCGAQEGEGVLLTRNRAPMAAAKAPRRPSKGGRRRLRALVSEATARPVDAAWKLSLGAAVQANADAWESDPAVDFMMGESLLRRETTAQWLRKALLEEPAGGSGGAQARPKRARREAAAAKGPKGPEAAEGAVAETFRWWCEESAALFDTYPVGNEMTVHYSVIWPSEGCFFSSRLPLWWQRDVEDIVEGDRCLARGCRRPRRVIPDGHPLLPYAMKSALHNHTSHSISGAGAAGGDETTFYYCDEHALVPLDTDELISLGSAAAQRKIAELLEAHCCC